MVEKAFKLPDDADAYIKQIRTRIRNLIDCSIWSGIEQEDIDSWLANFSSTEEKYFASRLLDSLIFRSSKQTQALIEQIFYKCIPDKHDSLAIDYLDLLKGNKDPHIRIVPVIRDDDPPTKSGPLVARLIKRHLKLNDKWMIWPFNMEDHANKGVKTFIFVDDFLGTGTQFKKFINRNDISKYFESHTCIYAPLASSNEGIKYLEDRYKGLLITSSEILDSSSNVFSGDSDCFNDGINNPSNAKSFYDDLLEKISGIKRDDNKLPYGYGHLGMTYIFQHASPNASIPLLWYEYDDFNPLFRR